MTSEIQTFSAKIEELMALVFENHATENQSYILIEEMAELTKELIKRHRGRDNRPELVEELSHVLASAFVTQAVLGIGFDELSAELQKKIDKYSTPQQVDVAQHEKSGAVADTKYLRALYKAVFDAELDSASPECRAQMQIAIYILQELGIGLLSYSFGKYTRGFYSQELHEDILLLNSVAPAEKVVFAPHARHCIDTIRTVISSKPQGHSLKEWLNFSVGN